MKNGVVCAVVAAVMVLQQLFSIAPVLAAEAEGGEIKAYEAVDSMTLRYTKWVGNDPVSKMKFTYQENLHEGLFVKEHTGVNLRRWSYLKFDISDCVFADISSAVLCFKTFGANSIDETLQILEVTEDWNSDKFREEQDVNPPGYTEEAVGSVRIGKNSGGTVYEADLTQYIKACMEQGKTEISLMLKMEASNDLSGAILYSERSASAQDYTPEDPAENAEAPRLCIQEKALSAVSSVKLEGPEQVYQIADGTSPAYTYRAVVKQGVTGGGVEAPEEAVAWQVFSGGEDITDTDLITLVPEGQTAVITLGAPLDSFQVKAWAVSEPSVSDAVAVTVFRASGGVEIPDQEDYDKVIENVRNRITGGTDFYKINQTCGDKIQGIAKEAQAYWDQMADPAEFGRQEKIWADLPWLENKTNLKARVSANITSTFRRLAVMAAAYTADGSPLQGDEALKTDILAAMDWMMEHIYNGTVYWSTRTYSMYNGGANNWWDWEIGSSIEVVNICSLLYGHVPQETVSRYADSIAQIITEPKKDVYRSRFSGGANRMWMCSAVLIQGALQRDPVRILAAWEGISEVMEYATVWDGFYRDGSFVEHAYYSYIGGYAISYLQTLGEVLYSVKGTAFDYQEEKKDYIASWIYDSFDPFMYRGASMDIGRGRAIGRYQTSDHDEGRSAILAMAVAAECVPPEDQAKIHGMIKGWITSDTYLPLDYQEMDPFELSIMERIMNGPQQPRTEYTLYHQFSRVDQAVLQQNAFAFGLRMYSNKRIKNFSNINTECGTGYNTSSGMGLLYNGDLGQYSGSYWATIDKSRIPGTTAVYGATMPADQFNGSDYAGGVAFDESAGVSGMILSPLNQNMTARKSWFLFDDKIVCVGNVDSSNGGSVETIAENRKLSGNKTFTADGAVVLPNLGDSEDFSGITWAHLEGNTGADSDIGYYFPAGGGVKAGKIHRTDRWSSINQLSVPPGDPEVSDDYLTMYFDHGTAPEEDPYAYVILPNRSAEQTQAYAQAPDVRVVKNTRAVQAVRETKKNMLAANFFTDEVQKADILTSYNKASVMLREQDGILRLYVSDPTQNNGGTIRLLLDKKLVAVKEKSEGVDVAERENGTLLTVHTNQSAGRGFFAELEVENVAYSIGAIAFLDEQGAVLDKNAQMLPETVRVQTEAFHYTEQAIPAVQAAALYDRSGRLIQVKFSEQKELTTGENLLRTEFFIEEQYRDGQVKAFVLDSVGGMRPLVESASYPYGVASLTVWEDAYVQGGKNADGNFGTGEKLVVKYQSGVTDEYYFRKTYLKFDLSQAQKGKMVKLLLRSTGTYQYAPVLGVYEVEDTDWSETGINWNNAPPLGRLVTSFTVPNDSTPTVCEIDVTELVNLAVEAGEKVLTLGLYVPGSTTQVPEFSAREAGSEVAPKLVFYR